MTHITSGVCLSFYLDAEWSGSLVCGFLEFKDIP